MKVSIFNSEILKKKCVKLVKKAVSCVMSGVLVLVLMSGCSNSANTHKNNESSDRISASESAELMGTDTSKNDEQNRTVNISEKDYSRDVSEDYVSVFIGNTDGVIVASRDNIVRYKDSSNAFTREASGFEDSSVFLEDDDYEEFTNYLESQKVEMPYSELFNVEHLMEREKNSRPVVHHGDFKLVRGKVDENELFKRVKYNNDNYNYSLTYTNEELKNICHIVAQNLNYSLSTNPYVDREALQCVLSDLKIFKEENVTNARITKDMVLAISPDFIENLQHSMGSMIDVFGATIAHESGHIPQMNCDDEVDKDKGDRIGFNVKYADEPINSLFWNWYFEGSAERIMMNANECDGIVYASYMNYLKYLKMAMSLNPDFDAQALENVSVSRNRDDFFALFGAVDEKSKVELSNMMFAIEMIQNRSDEFEKIYLANVNDGRILLSTEDWMQIKWELKSGLAINLSTMFYKNLADAVRAGKMSLKDVYHVISVFEAEIESHNTYDSINKFEDNRDFMKAYIDIQDAFFSCISTTYTYQEVVDGFGVYSYKDGASLTGLSEEAKVFLENRREELHESTTTNIRTFYNTLSEQYDRTLGLN